MTDRRQLKPGWKIWRFDQMATNVNVRIDNPSESGMEHYVGLEHLDPDSLRIRRWGSPDDVEATKLMFKKGDIIFGRRRAYQRKLGVAEFDGICSAHAMVLRAKPEVVLPEFLPFFMQSDLFMNRAVEISVGSLSPTINWKTMAIQEFALPSLVEQKNLVGLLSAIQSAFDAYREALDVAQTQLTNIRDSIMWGGEHQQLKDSLIGSIPESWQAKLIGDMVDFQGGSQPPAHTFEFSPSSNNVRLIQIRDYKSSEFLTYVPKALAKKFCDENDVMIGRYGPPVFQILRGLTGAYNVALIKAVPRQGLSKRYLYHFLKEKALLSLIEGLSRRSCGQAGVDMDKLKRYALPLPPLDEQERLSDIFDSFELSVKNIQARINKLGPLRGKVITSSTEVVDVLRI
ncbi:MULTISPECIES: restriction endonuclease subunit S [Methylomonas]|uniref:restriction endonuclease subunit S n=1 Tax=Methylomonas TaxID=416 RepID=UPI000AAFCC48|nr:restriction endonuclease subunit S [Methylomonas koyamae]